MKRQHYARDLAGLCGMPLRRRLVLEGTMGGAVAAMLAAVRGMDSAVEASRAEPAAAREHAEAEAEAEAEAQAEADAQAEAEAQASAEEEAAEQKASREAAESGPNALYRRGDSGQNILTLQQKLSTSGYWCGTADGGYGHLTEQAVFALQKAHGLTRDGVAGPNVRAALAKNYRPSPAAGGSHIEVHLQSQLLLVVRSGSTSLVLNTSTANGERYEFKGATYTARTRPGDFAVWYTHPTGWKDGELGEMWRPMFYSGNYAIHGSRSIPPWAASHGCARVSVGAMDMIWADELMSIGSRVLVV
ncbi:MAG: L,D-transpeptidase family protein [Ornithinimicrobium sp.]